MFRQANKKDPQFTSKIRDGRIKARLKQILSDINPRSWTNIIKVKTEAYPNISKRYDLSKEKEAIIETNGRTENERFTRE